MRCAFRGAGGGVDPVDIGGSGVRIRDLRGALGALRWGGGLGVRIRDLRGALGALRWGGGLGVRMRGAVWF